MTLRAASALLLPQIVLLGGIGLATGWGVVGWVVAIAATAILDTFVARGLRHHHDVLGPADLVTITRATLTCAVTALVAASLLAGDLLDTSPWTTTITVLAVLSLTLDLVDGWVARWTATASPFGARADGEADAALMLALSIWITPSHGWWVLLIGLARYAFAAAGWVLPWLRAQLPPRYWRKVVTAVTSTILVVATAGIAPRPVVITALLVGLALITESFGRDIWWLWHHRHATEDPLRSARRDAYGQHDFVDQQGFMTADEIRRLAAAAGIGPDTRVLDLCCGHGGPGRLITRELGGTLLGVDADASAIAAARSRTGHLPCSYETGRIPPVPDGPFEVVLLLETMLAFRDKETLLAGIHAALAPGGRLACTVEVGAPLTEAERAAMPAADTVWPIPLSRLHEVLEQAGFEVTWQQDRTAAHRGVVDSLLTEFTRHEGAIAGQIGRGQVDDLLTSHRLWSDWLGTGRIRKVALVAIAQPVQRSDRA
ncbi:CDP-alcohol phosphatidyltransferase family protein [Janibacter alittae]|uniref:CDP-alcohol phosphatidyltransferase family protein n=1 Tax=Janibacter alittae TaxID=3115209 RepID=A0ABZ2MKU2_9MICO